MGTRKSQIRPLPDWGKFKEFPLQFILKIFPKKMQLKGEKSAHVACAREGKEEMRIIREKEDTREYLLEIPPVWEQP